MTGIISATLLTEPTLAEDESINALDDVEQAADLAPTLKQALAEDTVVVIDCPVDYAENMKLTEKLGQLHVKI